MQSLEVGGAATTAHLLRRIRNCYDDAGTSTAIKEKCEMNGHTTIRSLGMEARFPFDQLWAAPGMTELLLVGEDLLNTHYRTLRLHYPQGLPDHPPRNPSLSPRMLALYHKLKSQKTGYKAPDAQQKFAYIYFNMVLISAVQVPPSRCSIHDGRGVLRCGGVARAAQKRVLALWMDKHVREACRGGIAPAASLALTVFAQQSSPSAHNFAPGMPKILVLEAAIGEIVEGGSGTKYATQLLQAIATSLTTAEARGVNPWGAQAGEGVVDEMYTRSGAALLLAHNLLLNCPDCAGGERVLKVYLPLLYCPRFWITGEDIPDTKASLLETVLNSACNTSTPMRLAVWKAVECISTQMSTGGFTNKYQILGAFFRHLQRGDPRADTAAELRAWCSPTGAGAGVRAERGAETGAAEAEARRVQRLEDIIRGSMEGADALAGVGYGAGAGVGAGAGYRAGAGAGYGTGTGSGAGLDMGMGIGMGMDMGAALDDIFGSAYSSLLGGGGGIGIRGGGAAGVDAVFAAMSEAVTGAGAGEWAGAGAGAVAGGGVGAGYGAGAGAGAGTGLDMGMGMGTDMELEAAYTALVGGEGGGGAAEVDAVFGAMEEAMFGAGAGEGAGGLGIDRDRQRLQELIGQAMAGAGAGAGAGAAGEREMAELVRRCMNKIDRGGTG